MQEARGGQWPNRRYAFAWWFTVAWAALWGVYLVLRVANDVPLLQAPALILPDAVSLLSVVPEIVVIWWLDRVRRRGRSKQNKSPAEERAKSDDMY